MKLPLKILEFLEVVDHIDNNKAEENLFKRQNNLFDFMIMHRHIDDSELKRRLSMRRSHIFSTIPSSRKRIHLNFLAIEMESG